MARLLIYYAHPGHKHSQVNRLMYRAARRVDGATIVDLYAEYPRFDIDIDTEQQRLVEHDIIVFQCPMFWYSTPSLVKEWIDLVLEHGFAYGSGGDALDGKVLQFALTAAGPSEAYSPEGQQRFPVRTFLSPLEQTARLCHMTFPAPYLLFSALQAPEDGRAEKHVDGYLRLLKAYRDERYAIARAVDMDLVDADSLPVNTVA